MQLEVNSKRLPVASRAVAACAVALSVAPPPKSSCQSVFERKLAPDRMLFLGQRMQVAHQAFQTLLDHMCIDLRRRDIGMAEQRLHDAQIGAVVQKMTRERM